MRFLLAALLMPGLACAAIWPEAIGPFHRTSDAPASVTDRGLWQEYGLKEAETAKYESDSARFTATAWRLQDSTGAMAAFDWQRPSDSTPSDAAHLAAQNSSGLLLLHGSYLLSFQGARPEPADLKTLTDALLNVDTTSLPVLTGYLPAQDRIANSERYITGPISLQKFDPGIPPSIAGFHLDAEAQLGVFQTPKGNLTLAIFNYPTHQIAMQKAPEFQKLPGAVVKRSGPLVAVVLNPPDPDFAEHLLSAVRFQAEVTRDEYVPTRRDNIGNLLLNAFILIGILLAFSLVSGLALGGFRAFWKRRHHGEESDALVTLHLEQR